MLLAAFLALSIGAFSWDVDCVNDAPSLLSHDGAVRALNHAAKANIPVIDVTCIAGVAGTCAISGTSKAS